MGRVERALLSLCQRVEGSLPAGSPYLTSHPQADTYWKMGEHTIVAFGSRREEWMIVTGQQFFGDEAQEMLRLGR